MIYDLYFRAAPRRQGSRSLLSAAVQFLQSVKAARDTSSRASRSRRSA